MTSPNENNVEQKIEQQQNTQAQKPQAPVEPAPVIKSEENQANWKAFREQREAERKAREEAVRIAAQKSAEAEALRQALEAVVNKPGHIDQEIEETEDQRIERRVNQIIQERETKAEKERQEREQREFPQKLISAHPDFQKVCTTENLDYFDYHYPELAAPFKAMPESFEKWSAIYKAVKRFIPNVDSKQDQSKVEKNLSKPGSISAPGVAHGGNAMPSARLDEARKQANWERMQRVMKGLKD